MSQSSTSSPAKPDNPTAPRRRSQEERRQESTMRMLEAAAELFAQQGFERTTFVQIGEKSGYSNGLIAHRFGTKTAIVDALVQEIRERTSAGVAQAAWAKSTGMERLSEIVRVYVEAVLSGGVWLRALFVLMTESVGPLAQKRDLFAGLNRTFIGLIERMILDGQKNGEMRPDASAHELAVDLVATLRGLTLLWLIDPSGIDIAAMSERKRKEFIKTLQKQSDT